MDGGVARSLVLLFGVGWLLRLRPIGGIGIGGIVLIILLVLAHWATTGSAENRAGALFPRTPSPEPVNAWPCPGLMDTPKSAKVRALGVTDGERAEAERRRFSEEYKAETVRLMRSSGQSMGQMALELGIGETALRRWAQQAEVEAGRGPAGALKRSEREELAELRRENQRLRMEREILKKATAFFAKESE